MVGLVVCMLVGLAAMGSATMFTASQRQGIGTGGSLINANTALNALRDDVSATGLGFFGDSRYLCNRLNLSVGATVVQNGAAFTPVRLTAEAAGDRIDVVYASQVASGANVLLNGAATATAANLRSMLPATVNQAVLLAPETPGDPCTVRTVTSVTASTVDEPQRLAFANTGLHNQAAFTTPVTYPDKARVAVLGELRWARYRLEGTDLRLERPLGLSPVVPPVVLARNVMAFRAQYGVAGTAAGTTTALATWEGTAGAFATLTPVLLPRVRAVRIGLVTRSPQIEKRDAAGNCVATETLPTLFGTAITPDVTDWQCYRFRTVIVVVPLRNLVIGLT
jgi:type IV pilus assembly protein PilW